MCVCRDCTELAGEFQSVLDNCPSNMAKRWLVLRVCSSVSLCYAELSDVAFYVVDSLVFDIVSEAELTANRLRDQLPFLIGHYRTVFTAVCVSVREQHNSKCDGRIFMKFGVQVDSGPEKS